MFRAVYVTYSTRKMLWI